MAILAAARENQKYPRLSAPDATATVDNPLCGDRVTIDVHIHNELVVAVGQRVRGCLLCEAASTLIAQNAPKSRRAELSGLRERVAEMLNADSDKHAEAQAVALELGWSELRLFHPVRPYKSRHECVLLPFEALAKALAMPLL